MPVQKAAQTTALEADALDFLQVGGQNNSHLGTSPDCTADFEASAKKFLHYALHHPEAYVSAGVLVGGSFGASRLGRVTPAVIFDKNLEPRPKVREAHRQLPLLSLARLPAFVGTFNPVYYCVPESLQYDRTQTVQNMPVVACPAKQTQCN